jgi:tetratricopeptide (TPR) repeat protein
MACNQGFKSGMRSWISAVAATCWLFGGALTSAAAQRPANPPVPQATSPAGADSQAEAYFNFMMGHLYEGNFRSSSQKADAERAIEFYKKAYALNPTSPVIGEQLAEMYFVSQQLGDAIVEAQSVLKRDPANLGARRLLSRIYIRSLGDQQSNADQGMRANLAIDQLREIVRLDPADSESALWLARLYRLVGQDNPAEQTLRTLLAKDSDNINGVAQLAQLLVDHNNLTEAVPLLESFLEDTPNGDLYDLLGDAYTRMNNLPSAEKAYRSAVQVEPDRARHLRGLAQTLFSQERLPEALVEYQRLAELRPDDSDNYLRMAVIYRRLQRLDDAARQILLARQKAPTNLEVIYNQATLYEDQGRFEDAVKVANEAVNMVKSQEVTPGRRRNLAILYQLQGRLNRSAGNYTAAIDALRELQKLGPEEDQRSRLLIVESYRDARDLPSAFAEMTKALAAYPNDRSLKINQALLYGENGQPDQAAQSLRALLTRSPADLEIQINVAQVYLQNRRYAEAEDALRAADALAGDAEDKETTEFLRASLYERQQKFDQAERIFKGILAANPRHSGALNYYGYMLAEQGVRLDEAVALITRALAEDPGNASYLDSMGWARFKQDRLQEAEEYLRKAVSRNGHNPEILAHLGDVLAKSGREDLAAQQWEKALAEWRRSLPADQEPAKITELEQKLSRVKNRVAQQAAPAAQPR